MLKLFDSHRRLSTEPWWRLRAARCWKAGIPQPRHATAGSKRSCLQKQDLTAAAVLEAQLSSRTLLRQLIVLGCATSPCPASAGVALRACAAMARQDTVDQPDLFIAATAASHLERLACCPLPRAVPAHSCWRPLRRSAAHMARHSCLRAKAWHLGATSAAARPLLTTPHSPATGAARRRPSWTSTCSIAVRHLKLMLAYKACLVGFGRPSVTAGGCTPHCMAYLFNPAMLVCCMPCKSKLARSTWLAILDSPVTYVQQ